MRLHTHKMLGLLAASLMVAACGNREPTDPATSVDAQNPTPAVAQPPTPAVAESPVTSALPWGSIGFTEFGGDPATIQLAGQCSAGGINGVAPTVALAPPPDSLPPTGAIVPRDGEVNINGWMADANGQVPTDALLVLQGVATNYAVTVVGGVARPDVAKVMGNEGLKTSGYMLKTTLHTVMPGDYRLWLMYGGPSATRACKINTTLRVVAGSAG